MRLFIAINLSDAVKGALIDAQNAMYDRGVRGNFTREENLHVTLAFIGEYPSAQPVCEALENVSFSPFTLALDGMGRFGDLWWAGMRRCAPLDAVARRIRHALAEAGIPFDRKRFSPHITLVRRATGELPELTLEGASMTVSRVSLMRSDRGKSGMIYTEVGGVDAE